jgi:catechol 2,3-dioxygenase-like lactoylglutathione lyase family enzyme
VVVITGVHAIVYSRDAEADRAFFRDVLGWRYVDAHEGWLIFAQPPAELAVHPDPGAGHHELFLMCDDVRATLQELEGKGLERTRPISEERFGLLTAIRLPGGGELGIYEPRHPSPLPPAAAE